MNRKACMSYGLGSMDGFFFEYENEVHSTESQCVFGLGNA